MLYLARTDFRGMGFGFAMFSLSDEPESGEFLELGYRDADLDAFHLSGFSVARAIGGADGMDAHLVVGVLRNLGGGWLENTLDQMRWCCASG